MSSTREQIRVLHIDDDPAFVDMAATYLDREEEHFEVETATSASEGLDRLTDNVTQTTPGDGIDCIVSDHDMPGMDGLAFLEAVRNQYPNLPFILFTGKGSEEIASEAITAGVSEYLNKKTGTEQYTVLANRIENLVNQSRAERQLEATNKRVRNLYSELTDAIFSLDTETRFTHLNDQAEELLDRSEAEVLGEKITDVLPAGLGTQFEFGIQKALTQNTTVEFEEYYSPPDAWHHVRAVPTEDGVTVHSTDVTEKKEAELQVQRQSERLQTVLQSLPVVLFTFDEEGTVLLAEGEGLEGVGLEASEYLGESLFDIYPGTPIAEDARRTFNGEETYSTGEFNGHFFEMWCHPVENGDDIDDEGIAVAIDITDREKYERDFREQEAFIESIFEAIPDVLYAFDKESTMLGWNEQLSTTTGYADAEIAEMGPLDFVADEYSEELQETSAQVFTDGTVATHQVSFVTKADERIPMEVTAAPVKNEDGTIIGLTGTGRDITGRRKHETYRRRLYELTADTELTTDETIDQVLDLGREYLGMESGFLTHIEDGTQRIVRANSPHEALQPGSECPLSEAYCQKTIKMDEPLIVAHAGASGWEGDPAYERFGLEAYAGAKLRISGERYGTVCFADRSPRERGFTEVEQSFMTLIVRGIESQLEHYKYETKLERQNEQLQEFASVISHDLRNPLTVANGYLGLAWETGIDEYFLKIENAHDRMDAIIEDVLTLARQGEVIGETTSVSLEAVAGDAWETVATENAELVKVSGLTEVEADRGRLKQLFENLYRNAVEHAGEDPIVRVGRYPGGFYIEDDGPGIPASEYDYVFNHGYTDTDTGNGLGLSIVETIVTAHGWEIGIKEGSDGGARFEIRTGTARGSPSTPSLGD